MENQEITPLEILAEEFDDTTFSECVEQIRAGFKLIDDATKRLPGEIGELFNYVEKMHSAVFAQLLMNHLDDSDGRMSLAAKAYWMAVGDYIGPDWLVTYKKVGGFMAKVDEF